MGKKFVIGFTSLIMASFIWLNAGFISSAALCEHKFVPRVVDVDHWEGSHEVTNGYSSEICDYGHIVFREYRHCVLCGYTILIGDYHTEHHSLCGASY